MEGLSDKFGRCCRSAEFSDDVASLFSSSTVVLCKNTADNALLYSAIPENPAAVHGPNSSLINTQEAPGDFRGFILG